MSEALSDIELYKEELRVWLNERSLHISALDPAILHFNDMSDSVSLTYFDPSCADFPSQLAPLPKDPTPVRVHGKGKKRR